MFFELCVADDITMATMVDTKYLQIVLYKLHIIVDFLEKQKFNI